MSKNHPTDNSNEFVYVFGSLWTSMVNSGTLCAVFVAKFKPGPKTGTSGPGSGFGSKITSIWRLRNVQRCSEAYKFVRVPVIWFWISTGARRRSVSHNIEPGPNPGSEVPVPDLGWKNTKPLGALRYSEMYTRLHPRGSWPARAYCVKSINTYEWRHEAWDRISFRSLSLNSDQKHQ